MTIKEIRIFAINGASKLKGKASVTFSSGSDSLTVKDFRINDDGIKEPWVGLPSEKYIKNGETKFKNNVWLSPSLERLVASAIVDDYKKTKAAS